MVLAQVVPEILRNTIGGHNAPPPILIRVNPISELKFEIKVPKPTPKPNLGLIQ